MADKILFVKSAFKHGYTQVDIEVFYNIIDDDTIRVFHAMALRDKIAVQMDT
jgi:hypothetical protein